MCGKKKCQKCKRRQRGRGIKTKEFLRPIGPLTPKTKKFLKRKLFLKFAKKPQHRNIFTWFS